MSLVIHFEQGTKKLNRLLYVPNNIAEIIESDGITFYEAMETQHLKHPFELYIPIKESDVDTNHLTEAILALENLEYCFKNGVINGPKGETPTKQSTTGDNYQK